MVIESITFQYDDGDLFRIVKEQILEVLSSNKISDNESGTIKNGDSLDYYIALHGTLNFYDFESFGLKVRKLYYDARIKRLVANIQNFAKQNRLCFVDYMTIGDSIDVELNGKNCIELLDNYLKSQKLEFTKPGLNIRKTAINTYIKLHKILNIKIIRSLTLRFDNQEDFNIAENHAFETLQPCILDSLEKYVVQKDDSVSYYLKLQEPMDFTTIQKYCGYIEKIYHKKWLCNLKSDLNTFAKENELVFWGAHDFGNSVKIILSGRNCIKLLDEYLTNRGLEHSNPSLYDERRIACEIKIK